MIHIQFMWYSSDFTSQVLHLWNGKATPAYRAEVRDKSWTGELSFLLAAQHLILLRMFEKFSIWYIRAVLPPQNQKLSDLPSQTPFQRGLRACDHQTHSPQISNRKPSICTSWSHWNKKDPATTFPRVSRASHSIAALTDRHFQDDGNILKYSAAYV